MNTNLSTKQGLLMKTLTDFYKDNSLVYKIIPILNGSHHISLRIIDWFATNYSKKNNISYIVTKLKHNTPYDEQFIVYLNYKNQLKAYSKKQFDPFCRRDRLQHKYDGDKILVTTVGQLNFFRWALENNIIDYIEANIQDIENDMNKNIRKNYSKKKKKSNNSNTSTSKKLSRKKRHELSVSATKFVNKHKHAITLDLN